MGRAIIQTKCGAILSYVIVVNLDFADFVAMVSNSLETLVATLCNSLGDESLGITGLLDRDQEAGLSADFSKAETPYIYLISCEMISIVGRLTFHHILKNAHNKQSKHGLRYTRSNDKEW